MLHLNQTLARPSSPPPAFRAPTLSEGLMGRKGGIIVSGGYEGLDIGRLQGLIEAGFRGKLVEGYFESPARGVVLQGDYLGAAIIKDLGGTNYLDKFVVVPEAQGKGLGNALWDVMKEHYPSILWRAVPANPCNPWYERKSDGSVRIGEWKVFWCDLDHSAAMEAAAVAARLPKTIFR